LAKLAGFRADVATAEKRLARLPAPDEDEVRLIQQAGLDARARVNEAKGKVQEAAERATRARVELERLQKLDESTKEKREAREKLLANVDQLAILDRAYGRDGLPARYLENVALPHIEQAASRTLSRLGAGCRVQFQTERAKKSGGAKDELYVQVVWDNGDEQEYRHFSGGEKTRIALSIALALAEFLAGRDRASDLLVVDEPQFLDGAGMEALVEILRELNARVPKVMLVAHDPRLAEAFDQTIRVVREGGRSRLADGMVSGENPERGLDLPRETPSATSPGVAA
ncbi:MAG TPA: SMC family ATPase, partial [Polyangia bacterium]|nr:SMC family ATPase [Polyangia bacterium]